MAFINPVKGRITSRFGTRTHPINGGKSFHSGVDISLPVGTTIVAPASGQIIQAWDDKKGGVCLAMLTENGVRFGFGHLLKRLVRNGEAVIEGQPIAESGNTGASTNPHLHFTMKMAGAWLDPLDHFNFK